MSPTEQTENAAPATAAPVNTTEIRTPQMIPSIAGNVDRIRDILFGSQMRDYEVRFSRLEETLAKETAEIRENQRRRFDQLEQYIKHEFEALDSRFRAEREDRSNLANQHSRGLAELGESLTRRLRDLDDRGAGMERELRATLLENARELSEAMQRRHEEVSTLVERRFHELRHGKTDRAALAGLFSELALRLNDEFHIPGAEN